MELLDAEGRPLLEGLSDQQAVAAAVAVEDGGGRDTHGAAAAA